VVWLIYIFTVHGDMAIKIIKGLKSGEGIGNGNMFSHQLKTTLLCF